MKIRGITVGTPIKPEKAVVKCQNLTEEEKAQARANIGAAAVGEAGGGSSTLIVTIDEEGMASHTSEEIYAHVQGGGSAILEADGELYPIQHYDGDFLFGGVYGTVFSGYWVLSDGSTEFVTQAFVEEHSLESVIDAHIEEKFPSVTQEEYDSLVEAGTVDESKYYMIVG